MTPPARSSIGHLVERSLCLSRGQVVVEIEEVKRPMIMMGGNFEAPLHLWINDSISIILQTGPMFRDPFFHRHFL